jgi:hypothetical protein
MFFEPEYKLDNVAAVPVPADEIDTTFRSSTIGQFTFLFAFIPQTVWGN